MCMVHIWKYPFLQSIKCDLGILLTDQSQNLYSNIATFNIYVVLGLTGKPPIHCQRPRTDRVLSRLLCKLTTATIINSTLVCLTVMGEQPGN